VQMHNDKMLPSQVSFYHKTVLLHRFYFYTFFQIGVDKMRQKTAAPAEKVLFRVALYIRVSTDRQVKEGDSIRDQLATGQKYVDSHEDMILVDTYIDDGITGQKLKRDDFQRLLGDVCSGKIDLIIFTRLDRWFRNLRHYLNTQDILDHHGVSWAAIEQPYFDTSTPHGRAFVNNSMIWAELEAQNDSDRILGVFDDKVDNGEVLSGSTPLGYSIENKHLVPDADAPTAVSIFNFYRKSGNLSQTLRYMESDFGLVRSSASLKNMLTNTKYIGEFRDNKAYCPAIIDRDLFYDVQRLLQINIKDGKSHDYIFSGLIVCDECDHIMSGCQQRSAGRVRLDGTRKVYKYNSYRCRQGVNLHRCPNRKIVYENSLESLILDRIRPDLEQYIAEYEVANLPALRTDAKRKSIENKMQKLKDLYLNDLITMDEFKLDREKLLLQLEKLNAEETRPVKDLSYLRDFLKMDFESVYDSFSIAERRELWRSIIKEIRVDHNKNVRIIFL
jgi:DNA invertase Pin-like site-specific DNA recombinase